MLWKKRVQFLVFWKMQVPAFLKKLKKHPVITGYFSWAVSTRKTPPLWVVVVTAQVLAHALAKSFAIPGY